MTALSACPLSTSHNARSVSTLVASGQAAGSSSQNVCTARSVGQICSRASVPANLAACASVIRRAAAAGAKLVLLPEAADFIAPQSDVSKLSAPLDGSPFVDGIKAAARKGEVWVGVGVHEQGPEEKCWNTQLVSGDREGSQQCELWEC